MKSSALLAILLCAGPAHADLRVAIANDVLTGGVPPYDDDGFTNDIDLRFWRPVRDFIVGGQLFDRWVTEVPREAGGRRDQIDLLATIARTWGSSAARDVTVAGRIGPTFGGNLGGRAMQNGFHGLCSCGDTLDHGLQARYDGGFDAGAVIGTRITGRFGTSIVQAYGVTDAQLALGAGVSFLDAAAGARLVGHLGRVELGAHAELALIRFVVSDPGLALTGGYGAGWQSAYRVGIHVAWSRYRFEYEYRDNEGGSGEPVGVIAFTVKQAGTAF
jgi:hypothetical protein